MSRLIGIWDTGDQFIYKVWSKLGGNWKKYTEFVRNVVRPRGDSELYPISEEKDDTSQL